MVPTTSGYVCVKMIEYASNSICAIYAIKGKTRYLFTDKII